MPFLIHNQPDWRKSEKYGFPIITIGELYSCTVKVNKTKPFNKSYYNATKKIFNLSA